MNQKVEKPVSDFTEKQRRAFQACMRFISIGSNYRASKGALVSVIRKSEVYSRKHDAIKTLKMFLKNPNIPLELDGEMVVRTDISTALKGEKAA